MANVRRCLPGTAVDFSDQRVLTAHTGKTMNLMHEFIKDPIATASPRPGRPVSLAGRMQSANRAMRQLLPRSDVERLHRRTRQPAAPNLAFAA